MRPEIEVEALLSEIQAMLDANKAKRHLERKRMVGAVAIQTTLEWVLGMDQDRRGVLTRLVRAEVVGALKHANK